MFNTINDILFHSRNNRAENLSVGHTCGYTLRMPIGPYSLSIALGEGAYCTPREVLEDPTNYEEVEVGISDDEGLLSLRMINDIFGDDVAKLCDGYGWTDLTSLDYDVLAGAEERHGERSTTVMPYITWEQTIMVANAIDRVLPEAKDLV